MTAPAYTGAAYAPAYPGVTYAPAYPGVTYAPAYPGVTYAPAYPEAYAAPGYAGAVAPAYPGATAPAYMPLVADVVKGFQLYQLQSFQIHFVRFHQVHCLQLVAKVVRQEMAARNVEHWESGLCDCFEDASTCCYGFWCCPCLACTVSEKFGENRCLPLCDICGPAITAAFGLPLCVPPAVLSLRVAMRNRYGIKGSLCKDIAVACCCEWCSWCQMHREIKRRTKHVTVVVQQQNVMQMQPAPVMMVPAYPAAPVAGFVSYPEVVTVSP
ncbi:uncharacterized protein [Clinocottus analis]|uniref:uncharacterized protein n=1 Tax=Clinocottus analis TaxID=304258 RepID=UPI0035C06461